MFYILIIQISDPLSALVDLCYFFFLYSDLELKPQGILSVTVVKATSLKNKELIGKSDPYVRLYVRPMFKVKTKVIDDNLNPEWNEKFDLIVEDKETQSVIFEVILYFLKWSFCFKPLDSLRSPEIRLYQGKASMLCRS